MIAIRVRYMHPTNRRGGRWQATDGRNYLYASFAYEDEAKEKLELANQFKLKFLPHSPELNPIPFHFDHKAISPSTLKPTAKNWMNCCANLIQRLYKHNGIADFVLQHCILK